MGKQVQVPAILEGVSLRKDGGVSLRFTTQELSVGEISTINEFFQKFGWLLFSDNSDQVAPKETINKDLGGKTPSQRLRAVLYILYQQSGQSELTFDEFYSRRMEQMIDHVKGKLAE